MSSSLDGHQIQRNIVVIPFLDITSHNSLETTRSCVCPRLSRSFQGELVFFRRKVFDEPFVTEEVASLKFISLVEN